MKLGNKKSILGIAAFVAGTMGLLSPALAERPDDGLYDLYTSSFEDKVVAFVPIGMYDLTQGWIAAMEHSAERLGYDFQVRDPNWSIDAGAQALEQFIAEEPDILIFQNNDMHAYTKLVQRAMQAGINVIQMNLKTPVNSDAFIGGDWYAVGAAEAMEAVRLCGEGTSGKVAILQGPVTSPPSLLGVAGIEDTLEDYPEITIVANQAADWDATKAHSIASTLLRQHQDLCAFVGLWDNQDIGAAAAIREAGMEDQVIVITEGGGHQTSGCENIRNGMFASYTKVDTRDQARQLASAVEMLLQVNPEPGSQPFGLYTDNQLLTPETVSDTSCWTIEQIRQGG